VLGVFLLADGIGIAVAARMVRRLRDPRPAFFVHPGGRLRARRAADPRALLGAAPCAHQPACLADVQRLRGDGLLTVVLLTVLVVAPPSFLIGMTFPFVQRAVQQDLASVGARVGWVQLANILGNAAGSIGTGIVTFHLLGTAGTLQLLAVLSTLLVLGWLWKGRARPPAGDGARRRLRRAVFVLPSNAALWSRLHAERPGQRVAWAEDRSGVAFFRDDATSPDPHGPFFIQASARAASPSCPSTSCSAPSGH
jgi:hypothetical protein